jgi:tetraspanin-13/31
MCGNFNFSKNALVALNICYILVSFLLIGVATYGKTSSYVESLPIIGGIAACGVFLLVISIIGLIAAVRHHQVGLFFYMIVLLVIFVIQFSVACACLAVHEEQELHYAKKGWEAVDNETRFEAETVFQCCGFDNYTQGVSCEKVPTCGPQNPTEPKWNCPMCAEAIQDKINYAFNAAGGLGLFFSFTELASVVYAFKFRTQIRQMSELA